MTTGANAAATRGVATANRNGIAAATTQTANPASGYTYNYMYPYLNNQMRTTLNPGVTTSQSTSPINAIVRTEQLSQPRRVVARPTPATNTNSGNSGRAATNTAIMTQRRVVPRPISQPQQNARSATNATVARNVSRNQSTDATQQSVGNVVTSARCLADYTECMNRYCERPDTAYNRCYCSAKLAQIDAEYQPQIDSLAQQIINLQYGNTSLDNTDFREFWATSIAQYSGSDSWANIDDALNIDWASMESRVRGQNAFITGHDYCVQHITGCFYMASNLRDAYRSTIANDCANYQSGLERLKTVAESFIEGYQE